MQFKNYLCLWTFFIIFYFASFQSLRHSVVLSLDLIFHFSSCLCVCYKYIQFCSSAWHDHHVHAKSHVMDWHSRIECSSFLFLTILWFSLLWIKECIIAKWVVFHVPLLQNRNLVCHYDCCFPCSHSVAALCILIFELLELPHFWYLWQHTLLFSMVRWSIMSTKSILSCR